MSTLGKTALVAVTMSVTTPAHAGWQSAAWDMTAEEVASVMGGQAPLSRGSRGDRLGEKEIKNVGEYRTESARFRTVYYYDQEGLSQVALYRKAGDCEKVVAGLLAEHGRPLLVSDQLILRLTIWHDEVAQNRIRLMTSRGICDVHYERLSDYKAIDLSNARSR